MVKIIAIPDLDPGLIGNIVECKGDMEGFCIDEDGINRKHSGM